MTDKPGLPFESGAKKVRVSRNTVSNFVKRHCEGGGSVEQISREGGREERQWGVNAFGGVGL